MFILHREPQQLLLMAGQRRSLAMFQLDDRSFDGVAGNDFICSIRVWYCHSDKSSLPWPWNCRV